jgi:hypothetical protein
VNIGIALAIGNALPPWTLAASAALVGFAGYGISLTLFVVALRELGTARTGAYFSVARSFGALVTGSGGAADGVWRFASHRGTARARRTSMAVTPIRTRMMSITVTNMVPIGTVSNPTLIFTNISRRGMHMSTFRTSTIGMNTDRHRNTGF